jgi:hypothetical protein
MLINAAERNTHSITAYKVGDERNITERSKMIPEESKSLVEPKDEYIPSGDKPTDNSSSYKLVEDEKGLKRIVEENPAKTKEPKKAEPIEGKSSGGATANNDKVNREIEQLREEKQRLEQELSRVGSDEAKRKQIEQQVSQVNAELAAKDNESYKKANTTVSYW